MHAPQRAARDLRSDVRVRIQREHGDRPSAASQPTRRLPMQWTRPAFEDLRFGFEITMYIASR